MAASASVLRVIATMVGEGASASDFAAAERFAFSELSEAVQGLDASAAVATLRAAVVAELQAEDAPDALVGIYCDALEILAASDSASVLRPDLVVHVARVMAAGRVSKPGTAGRSLGVESTARRERIIASSRTFKA